MEDEADVVKAALAKTNNPASLATAVDLGGSLGKKAGPCLPAPSSVSTLRCFSCSLGPVLRCQFFCMVVAHERVANGCCCVLQGKITGSVRAGPANGWFRSNTATRGLHSGRHTAHHVGVYGVCHLPAVWMRAHVSLQAWLHSEQQQGSHQAVPSEPGPVESPFATFDLPITFSKVQRLGEEPRSSAQKRQGPVENISPMFERMLLESEQGHPLGDGNDASVKRRLDMGCNDGGPVGAGPR